MIICAAFGESTFSSDRRHGAQKCEMRSQIIRVHLSVPVPKDDSLGTMASKPHTVLNRHLGTCPH